MNHFKKSCALGALLISLSLPSVGAAQGVDSDQLNQLLTDPAGFLALADPSDPNLVALISQATLGATPEQLSALANAAAAGGLTSEQVSALSQGFSQAVASTTDPAVQQAVVAAALSSGSDAVVSTVAQSASPNVVAAAIQSVSSSALSASQEAALASGLQLAVSSSETNPAVTQAIVVASVASGRQSVVSSVAQVANAETLRTAIQAAGSASLSDAQVAALASGIAEAVRLRPNDPSMRTVSDEVANSAIPGLSESFSQESGQTSQTVDTSPVQPTNEQQTALLVQEETAPPAEEPAPVGEGDATAAGTAATESGTTNTTTGGTPSGSTSTPTGNTSSGGGGSTAAQSPTN